MFSNYLLVHNTHFKHVKGQKCERLIGNLTHEPHAPQHVCASGLKATICTGAIPNKILRGQGILLVVEDNMWQKYCSVCVLLITTIKIVILMRAQSRVKPDKREHKPLQNKSEIIITIKELPRVDIISTV